MENRAELVRIIGLGNLLVGDEGVGVHAARLIQHEGGLPEGVECIDGGTGALVLLSTLQEARRIILIDATQDGQPPGTITRLQPRYSSDYPPSLAAHDIGLKELLDSLYLLGHTPEVVLFAVSIGACDDLSTELTAPVADALSKVTTMVRREVGMEIGSGVPGRT